MCPLRTTPRVRCRPDFHAFRCRSLVSRTTVSPLRPVAVTLRVTFAGGGGGGAAGVTVAVAVTDVPL